jgi:RNA polymerase sigma factor (sigma-70 family)
VREHALANLPRWITVTGAARLVGMRPADFSRRFEELTGVSYDWWNQEIHLEQVKRLLCTPYSDLKQIAKEDHRLTSTWDDVIPLIAEKSGFRDLVAFVATFRLHMRMTPAEYRVEQAIVRWSPKLLGVGLKKCHGNRADAEDAIQEALLRTLDKHPGFRGLRKPLAYICRVMLNEATDSLSEAQQFVSFNKESELPTASIEPDVVTALLRSDRDERRTQVLWEAYDNLSASERETIDLRVLTVPRWTFDEIAVLQGTAKSTAKRRYDRALDKLGKALEGG